MIILPGQTALVTSFRRAAAVRVTSGSHRIPARAQGGLHGRLCCRQPIQDSQSRPREANSFGLHYQSVTTGECLNLAISSLSLGRVRGVPPNKTSSLSMDGSRSQRRTRSKSGWFLINVRSSADSCILHRLSPLSQGRAPGIPSRKPTHATAKAEGNQRSTCPEY